MIEIRKAERRQSKLRLGIAGPSGSGKTMGALKLAHGIGSKIIMIDTERGSGDLYAHLFPYDIITLQPPYAPKNYVEAIHAAEAAGYDVIIIDSLSHAWSDEGGLLDQADKLSAGGNRFTVWANLTPQHRSLVNAMLNSPCHIIATVRSKQDYAVEKDATSGKSSVKKLGMAPVQREGMEYEFTVFMDVDINHITRVSKDRTDLFRDEVFVLDEATGQRILGWLNAGEPDTTTVKKKIMTEAKRLGLPITAEAWPETQQSIVHLTGLEFTEEHYDEIAKLLSEAEAKPADTEPPQDGPAAPAAPSAPVDAPAPQPEAAAAADVQVDQGPVPPLTPRDYGLEIQACNTLEELEIVKGLFTLDKDVSAPGQLMLNGQLEVRKKAIEASI